LKGDWVEVERYSGAENFGEGQRVWSFEQYLVLGSVRKQCKLPRGIFGYGLKTQEELGEDGWHQGEMTVLGAQHVK
jgi:hypothetical protein